MTDSSRSDGWMERTFALGQTATCHSVHQLTTHKKNSSPELTMVPSHGIIPLACSHPYQMTRIVGAAYILFQKATLSPEHHHPVTYRRCSTR